MYLSKLRRLSRIRLVPAVIIAALLVALGSGALFGKSPEGQSQLLVSLQDVPPELLEEEGITLLAPPDGASNPKVTMEAATSYAAGLYGGNSVREAALARLVDVSAVPPIGRLVWVVSYEPKTIDYPVSDSQSFQRPSFRTLYFLIFVDAETGKEISNSHRGVAECPAKPGDAVQTDLCSKVPTEFWDSGSSSQ